VKLGALGIGLLAAAGLGSALVGFKVGRKARGHSGSAISLDGAEVLSVPHAQGNIVLDGDMDDPGWAKDSARTHAFVGADGVTPARPHSEARLVWGDGYLYLGLYAADEDIRAKGTEHDVIMAGDDSFHVVFSDGKTDKVIDINPLGTITDGVRVAGSNEPLDTSWESGLHVSREADGTLNNPNDYDEEWVLEMAIPLDSLGLRGEKGERLFMSIKRCDVFRKGGPPSCGTYGVKTETGGKKGVIVLN
jgi:hypothetical protein